MKHRPPRTEETECPRGEFVQAGPADDPIRAHLSSRESARPDVAIGRHVVHAEFGGHLFEVEIGRLLVAHGLTAVQ